MKKMMFNDRYGLTQAVISGRKTVTRRVVKDAWWPIYKIEAEEIKGDIIHVIANNGKLVIEHKCPYKIGEIVAVAQCYADIHSELMIGDFGDDCYDSFKNAVVHDKAGWHNKMFVQADLMPHRIQITDIRIERLQDISDEDCLNEGIFVNEYIKNGKMRYHYGFDGFLHEREGWFAREWFNKPREAFASLIDKISGKGTWERNPFVWRIEFKLVK
jgi:hypothetical protein